MSEILDSAGADASTSLEESIVDRGTAVTTDHLDNGTAITAGAAVQVDSSTVITTSVEQTPKIVPIVTISFHKVLMTGERNYPYGKSGKPFLQIEVVGDRHTLEDVGELLFKHYMTDILGEELYEHVWRFEPIENGSGKAYNSNVPLLSSEMYVGNAYHLFPNSHNEVEKCRLSEGQEMLFFYDEGRTTRVFVSIDSVSAMASSMAVEQYPRMKETMVAEEITRKRKLISESPNHGPSKMDNVYPDLKSRLFERGVKFEIGQGSSEIGHSWAMIWGGGAISAYTSSLECLVPFGDMDEAFTSFDRAINKQTSPGYPTLTTLKRIRRESGVIEEIIEEGGSSGMRFMVHARPYPRSIPESEYKSEFFSDEMAMIRSRNYGDASNETLVSQKSRWAFNFCLEEGWEAIKSQFSFTKQFPKCSKWLSYPSKISYWMAIERGVLTAIKGKCTMRKADNVVHQTLRHDNLHDMFTDMESQIVLPKSWK